MKNIFKRQNDTEVEIEIFKNWSEMEEDLKKEIKKQKTEVLKALLSKFKASVLLGLGVLVIGLIFNELAERN